MARGWGRRRRALGRSPRKARLTRRWSSWVWGSRARRGRTGVGPGRGRGGGAVGALPPTRVQPPAVLGGPLVRLQRLLERLLHVLRPARLSGLGVEGVVVRAQATHRLLHLLLLLLP